MKNHQATTKKFLESLIGKTVEMHVGYAGVLLADIRDSEVIHLTIESPWKALMSGQQVASWLDDKQRTNQILAQPSYQVLRGLQINEQKDICLVFGDSALIRSYSDHKPTKLDWYFVIPGKVTLSGSEIGATQVGAVPQLAASPPF